MNSENVRRMLSALWGPAVQFWVFLAVVTAVLLAPFFVALVLLGR